ncbi:hypothetical protein [Devosia sp.]|uniref:hypothetical protein n=1 Tax=Devosia sp. TaxID=1871048 RepID=UPI001B165288|nr:hypothetical protein [Devosia sp.]MBO9590835.1 hypothetical protein [Devosia sp.]
MTTRHKQKRQDDARQPAQTPVADAIVLGTAAGGLVLGTMQAQGATPETHDGSQIAPRVDALVHDTTGAAPIEPVSPVPDGPLQDAGAAQPMVDSVQAAGPSSIDPVASQNPLPPALQDQLVHELSQQIAGAISKVMEGAEPGMSPAGFSQAISSDIVHSAQEIVGRLDIGALLTQTQALGSNILAQVDPAGIADGLMAETDNLADVLLTDLGALPEEILGSAVGALADLPSSLLGNEGPEGSGGLLSELFYADGGSDGLSIPDLSAAASSLVAGASDGSAGLLGLSYVDLDAPQGGHGLNALNLL